MEINKKVKVALIGIGGWAAHIADAIMKSNKVELVSCFTRNETNRKKFAEKYNCKPANSYEEILNDKDIEGVILETPNFVHCEQAIKAAEKGKHILIDKPITNRVEEAKKIVKICKEKGVILAVGHNTRRRAGHRKMKELIEKGVLGKIVMAESNFSHRGGLNLTPEQWRWYNDKCPGGPLIQLGVHHSDTLTYLLGKVKKVTALFSKVAVKAEIPDSTMTVFEFENGALGYIGSNYATPPIFYINIYGTEANLFCEYGNKLWIQEKGSSEKKEIEVKEVDDTLEEIEDFGDCIRQGKKPEVSGEEAIEALAIIEAAVKSAETGSPISLEEIIGTEA